jgi:hypothetical protein
MSSHADMTWQVERRFLKAFSNTKSTKFTKLEVEVLFRNSIAFHSGVGPHLRSLKSRQTTRVKLTQGSRETRVTCVSGQLDWSLILAVLKWPSSLRVMSLSRQRFERSEPATPPIRLS